MNGTERVRPLLQHIREEHRALHREVGSLRKNLVHPDEFNTVEDCQIVFSRRLQDLRRRLSSHFLDEANGGCIEEAVSYAPHLAAEATNLEHEHLTLIRDLDRILVRLAFPMDEATLRNCESQFESFSKKLLTHEARENQLLQRGFNVDLGLADE